jgi:hypothetical protein
MAAGSTPVQAGAPRPEGSRTFPEVVNVYGFGQLPDITPGRKKIRRLTGQSFVPVLVLEDGEVVADCANIAAWAREHPADSA